MTRNPLEMRESIIFALKRSLVGPAGPNESAWLGSPSPLGVVTDDFAWDEQYPIGPWVNSEGEEVIQTPPVFVYGVGILYPEISDEDAELANVELEKVLTDEMSGNDAIDPPTEAIGVDVVAGEASIDDESAPVESLTRPRTFAISLRVPISESEIELELLGGTYVETAVSNQRNPWWSRNSVSIKTKVDVSISNSKVHNIGSLVVTVGAEVKVQDRDTKIITVWIRNDSKAQSSMEISAKSLFQAEIRITAKELIPYDTVTSEKTGSLELLYRNFSRMAVGHGVDANANFTGGKWHINTESLPVAVVDSLTPDISNDGQSYAIGMLDLSQGCVNIQGAISRLLLDYGDWIKRKYDEIPNLPVQFQGIAEAHLKSCEDFIKRIRAGWDLACQNLDVEQVLTDMSAAMNEQRIAYSAELREVTQANKSAPVRVEGKKAVSDRGAQSYWRPFQIAFILASISSIVDPSVEDSSEVDVIWMPTGGGKTEAYLGLAGFTILWERLAASKARKTYANRSYTKILMRYTLRLLTAQQMTRAASLICALELIRQKQVSGYGQNEIRVGAWLGSATSANRRVDALENITKLLNERTDAKKFMLTRCPWCASEMGHVLPSGIAGYRKTPMPTGNAFRVLAYCPDTNCPFSYREITENGKKKYLGLPVFEVDEDIYQWPPDFIVATVDKVAQMSWRPDAQRIFGLKNGSRTNGDGSKTPAPRLFIQDELHLIAGPLGSIDGAFEAMLEHLCEVDGGLRPVIVASTATTKNFEEQLNNLYGRSGRLVPPPGLDISDSFFARRDEKTPGKAYVGVCATGYGSALNSQTRVVSILSHSAGILENAGENVDAWWTNIIFFSSRRSLGQLQSQIETNVKSLMRKLRQWSGVKSGRKYKDEDFAPTRNLYNLSQLTATSSEDVGEVLEHLSRANSNEKAIDVCFATSMIEVGLDVQRLGLMTVIGQPKSASQYIQVSGRVGRDINRPGIIVTVLSPQNVRDRSHYEGFLSWHERLYASVETSSVTPFTSRALERSGPSVMAAMLRILGDKDGVSKSVDVAWDSVAEVLLKRAGRLGAEAVENTKNQLVELKRIADSEEVRQKNYSWDQWNGKSVHFIYPAETPIPPERASGAFWKVLNSMRSVELDAGFQMTLKPGVENGKGSRWPNTNTEDEL
jgi:hypothetical protein